VIALTHQLSADGQPSECWDAGEPAWARVPGSSGGAEVQLLRSWTHVRAALIRDDIRNLADVGSDYAMAGVTLQRPAGLLRLAGQATKVREVLNPLWRRTAVERYRPAIRQLAQQRARQVRERNEADLVAAFALPLILDMIKLAVGKNGCDGRQLMALSDRTTGTLMHSPHDHPQVAHAWDELYALTTPAISAARSGSDDSLLSWSVLAMDATGMAPGDVADGVTTIYNGLPTTLPTLVRLLEQLLRNPDALQRCGTDSAPGTPGSVWIPRAVNAGLRAAAHFTFALPGVCTKTIRLDDQLTVREGTVVLPVIRAAHQDRARARGEGAGLDLDRFSGPGLAWGAGVHACLGRYLAEIMLVEAIYAFATVLAGWQLAPGPLSWCPGTMPVPASLPAVSGHAQREQICCV
jgi:cytochrome P450